MEREPKLLGYYNYTVILTYIGMLSGFLGILCAVEDRPLSAMFCLLAAGLCDMFDGAIASTRERTEEEKCFGIQIDSLSDLVCFGVLPGVAVYCMNRENRLGMWIAGLYVLCALIRLAYFNVDEQERQKQTDGARETYQGMPVTLSALFLPMLYSAVQILSWISDSAEIGLLLAMAVLFLLPVPLKKPKKIGKWIMVLCGLAAFALLLRVGAQL